MAAAVPNTTEKEECERERGGGKGGVDGRVDGRERKDRKGGTFEL